MKSAAVAFAVLVAIVAYDAGHARACSCMPPPDAITSYGKAAAVFTGQVASITPNADGFAVAFTVSEAFKGPRAAEISVQTARDSAACGYNFKQGASYLVYASGEPSALQVNICGRTAPIEQAGDDIAQISAMLEGNGHPAPDEDPGEPTEPAEPPATDGVDPGTQTQPPQTVQRKGCGCNSGTDAGAGLIVLAVIALVARRRNRAA